MLVPVHGCSEYRGNDFEGGAETDSGRRLALVAIASIGAAMIHFAVVPVHLLDWVLSGFFASAAAFQLIWALLAWNRPPAVLLAAESWAMPVWRPYGSFRALKAFRSDHAGEPEVVHAAGICVLLLECYVVMGAAWAWMRGWRAEPVSGLRSTLVLLTANSVVAVVVALGLASSLQNHDHHHPPAQAREPETPLPTPTYNRSRPLARRRAATERKALAGTRAKNPTTTVTDPTTKAKRLSYR